MQIPRILHQIWIGPRPLPAEYRKYRQTWRAAHPAWEFRHWGEREIAALGLRNARLMARVATESERSDLVRYELLHRFGGVYVDADFECLKPLDELIACQRFFVGQDRDARVFNTGLMGVVPEHPFLDLLIRAVPRNLALCAQHGVAHPNQTVGPWFFSRLVAEARPPDLHVYPTRMFYPYLWDELERAGEDFRRTSPESYAVHHWSFSWAGESPHPISD
jgi:inositol phosphorylceramide mannosyltransferase catalytic subunit